MGLKKFQERLYHEVGSSNYRIFRSYILRNKKRISFGAAILDKFVLLVKILGAPLLIRSAKYKSYRHCIFDLEVNYELRKKYIERLGCHADLGLINMNLGGKIEIDNVRSLARFLSLYLTTIISAFRFAASSGRVPVSCMARFYYSKLKVDLYRPKVLYIFYSYRLDNYLLSIYSSLIKSVDVYLMVNQMIHENLRYSYFENMRICFSSPLYKSEYDYIKNIGWIDDLSVEYIQGGNEFLINKKEGGFVYDLAFYSSGFWARKDGLYNDLNRYALVNRMYEDNVYSRVDISILMFLKDFSERNKLSYRVYLHPYEKEIINKYCVYPPYWDSLLDESRVIDEVNDCYEAEVGVVQHSSIFFDRHAENLDTYCYYSESNKEILQINLNTLSEYKCYGFNDFNDLESKLIERFKVVSDSVKNKEESIK